MIAEEPVVKQYWLDKFRQADLRTGARWVQVSLPKSSTDYRDLFRVESDLGSQPNLYSVWPIKPIIPDVQAWIRVRELVDDTLQIISKGHTLSWRDLDASLIQVVDENLVLLPGATVSGSLSASGKGRYRLTVSVKNKPISITQQQALGVAIQVIMYAPTSPSTRQEEQELRRRYLALQPTKKPVVERPPTIGFDNLPDEIKVHVAGYMQPKDLGRLATTNKANNNVAHDKNIWAQRADLDPGITYWRNKAPQFPFTSSIEINVDSADEYILALKYVKYLDCTLIDTEHPWYAAGNRFGKFKDLMAFSVAGRDIWTEESIHILEWIWRNGQLRQMTREEQRAFVPELNHTSGPNALYHTITALLSNDRDKWSWLLDVFLYQP